MCVVLRPRLWGGLARATLPAPAGLANTRQYRRLHYVDDRRFADLDSVEIVLRRERRGDRRNASLPHLDLAPAGGLELLSPHW